MFGRGGGVVLIAIVSIISYLGNKYEEAVAGIVPFSKPTYVP